MSYLTLFPSGKPLEGRAVSYYPERPARTFLGWVCGQGLNDARLCASSCRTGCLLVLEMNVFFVNRMNTPSYSPTKCSFCIHTLSLEQLISIYRGALCSHITLDIISAIRFIFLYFSDMCVVIYPSAQVRTLSFTQ